MRERGLFANESQEGDFGRCSCLNARVENLICAVNANSYVNMLSFALMRGILFWLPSLSLRHINSAKISGLK
jgi:hypothetical protein